MDLAELKAKRPQWTIEQVGLDLMCRRGAWRFRAADPDDADREIELRETPFRAAQPAGPC